MQPCRIITYPLSIDNLCPNVQLLPGIDDLPLQASIMLGEELKCKVGLASSSMHAT